MVGSYGKLLNVLKACKEATPEWPYLDAIEEQLLNSLASKWYTQGTVTVLDAATMLYGVSESTAHRRISTLVDKNVIQLETSDIDGRIKLVKPTTLTLYYFNQIGACLDQLT